MNIDEKTYEYMSAIEERLDQMLMQNPEAYSTVVDAMRYSLLGGGKRVRGILTLASCEQTSGSYEKALPAACAIEMVHCYSLIHDDLPSMDNDDLRRGKPSCHIMFSPATAILAGDALLTLAFSALAEIDDPAVMRECLFALSEAAGHKGMVLGQELDLASEGKNLSPTQLTRLHAHKTGALLNASVKMGALIGGADEKMTRALIEYANYVGLAFQIIDDVLNMTANEKELGKPVGSDVESGKATGASIYGINKARNVAMELTAKAIETIDAVFYNAEYLQAFAKILLARTK